MTGKTATDLTDRENQTSFRLYFVCGLLIIMFFLFDLSIPLGVAMGVLYVAVVLLSLWSPIRKFTVFVAIVSSVLTVGAIFLKPPVDEMWKVFFNRGLALFAIWVTVSLGLRLKVVEKNRQEVMHEREEVLKKIKMLSGFLPICSSCKKIRDDTGYWTQIERYVHEHSDADFTHSICPECSNRLYPELHSGKNDASDAG